MALVYPAFERAFRGIRIAHVHRSPDYAQALGSWPRRLPWVFTLHGLYALESWTHRPDLTSYITAYNRDALRAIAAAPVATVVADWLRIAVEERTSVSAIVTPPGIDAMAFERARPDAFLRSRGLAQGYLLQVWRQAQGDGLRWYVELARRRPDREVVLITDAPLDALRRGAPGPWPSNFHCFVGLSRLEVLSAVAGCGAYVSTLFYDATGNALAEAMACGHPVVGPDRMGPRELIRDSGAGFAYDPASFDDLVEAAAQAADHPEIGSRGRAFVRTYRSWERTTATFDALYEELAFGSGDVQARPAERSVPPSRRRATRERQFLRNTSRE